MTPTAAEEPWHPLNEAIWQAAVDHDHDAMLRGLREFAQRFEPDDVPLAAMSWVDNWAGVAHIHHYGPEIGLGFGFIDGRTNTIDPTVPEHIGWAAAAIKARIQLDRATWSALWNHAASLGQEPYNERVIGLLTTLACTTAAMLGQHDQGHQQP